MQQKCLLIDSNKFVYLYVDMETTVKRSTTRRIFRWAAWITGSLAVILIALELILKSSVITGLVNRVASEYIDGELAFDKIELSLFRRFPSTTLTLQDFAITYPADRFDEDESSGAQGLLFKSGCGETSDTLASFERFTASIRLGPLLTGKVRIPYLELSKPRIHAHHYGSGKSNWDIFMISDDTTDTPDTTEASLPEIMLGKISLNGNPRVVYTDNGDTLSALINLKEMSFRGRLDTRKLSRNRIGLRIDSLFAAARAGSDTLAIGMDRIRISEKNRNVKLAASAKAYASLSDIGSTTIPIDIKGAITLPERTGKTVTINGFSADIASIPIEASGEFAIMDDRLAINMNAGIRECRINDLLKGIVADIMPAAKDITTDSVLDFNADIKGDYVYSSGNLPDIYASIRIPSSQIGLKGLPGKLNLEVSAEGSTDRDGRLNIDIKKADISANGADLKIRGRLSDMLCADPAVTVKGDMDISLDSLVTLLPDSLGISASGHILAGMSGVLRMSQMNKQRFSEADLTGNTIAREIRISSPLDSLKAYLSTAEISITPQEKTSRTGETFKLLALKATIDSTDISLGSMGIKGKKVSLSAMNSADRDNDTCKVHRFGGRLAAERLIVADNAGMVIGINGSDNGFQILPKRGNPRIPVLTFTSRNKAIFLKDKTNRIVLSNATLGADATMNSIERRHRVKAYMDSLSRKYPGVPKDSLFHLIGPQGNRSAELPEWLKEEDFKKQDINFRLDETMAKYFREWDLNGKLAVEKGILMTPHFPLRNAITGFEGYFNNNQVRIDSLGIRAGKSELAAKGSLTGIQKILSGRGRNMLKLDLDVTSERMDANELLKAYTIGSRFNQDATGEKFAEASDEEYMDIIATDSTAYDSDESLLIVVPANLNADIRLNAKNIRYADLVIEKLSANAIMQERCLQITNTSAESNIGSISFDGFYATRSKKDIKAGFNIQFDDITAEKVIELMPAADTLMPILKSFYGRLNCEFAATTQLDTNMNLIIPSIKGIMRITGDDLYIKENQMFRTLARKLLFKNKKEGYIEHMSVEGIISDSTVEIFPFIMKMDRYTMALSGIQNLDMSFKYHMSLIRSPFLFKLGVDVAGEDFDNWKFKIGKPKYKSADMPAFSSVIDQTKINLVKSIKDIFRKGVDAAIKENHFEAVNEYMRRTKYVRAVDQKLEELSEEEQKQFEAEEAAVEAEENSITENQTNVIQ